MQNKTLLLAIACLSLYSAQAQDSTERHPRFKLSVNYQSTLHYYGRTDSLKSAGFFPLAECWLTKDFYVNAAPVFVNNRAQSFEYAGTLATAGYQHISRKWITSIYATKPFYRSGSQLVQSALKAQGGASVSFLNKILNLTAGGDLKYSSRTDVGASAGIDHIVRIQLPKKQVLVIDPSAYAYAGTQNFTTTYYQKQPSLLPFGGTTQAVNQDVERFTILSYEFSVPFVYVHGPFMALLTPSYVLPQNLVTIDGRPDLSERGEAMFYATATVKWTFARH